MILRFTDRIVANSLALILTIGMAASPLRADDVVTTKKVLFKRGASSATLAGSLKGYDSVRYELSAKERQKMSVKLTSKNTFLYFNVLNKKTDLALETEPAPREVTRWTGTLPKAGIYVVQVYLVRAEARRGGKANFKVSMALSSTK